MALTAGLAACGSSGPRKVVVGGPPREKVSFGDVSIQNAFQHLPSGEEFIEGVGVGRPPEGEKDQKIRRNASRDSAVIEAQKPLIAQLQKLVPREKIVPLLRQAQVAKTEYSYDDGCTIVLRIPKEAVVGKPPIE